MNTDLMEKSKYNELSILSKNLTRLMFDRNIDTKELSLVTGISISSLNSIRRGEGNPTLVTLVSIADFFNITVNDLVHIKTKDPYSAIIIPIYSLGDSHNLKPESVIENIYLNIGNMRKDENLFGIQIENSSMVPLLNRGNIFIIAPNRKFTDGDIVLVKVNDKFNILRKVFIDNDQLLFQNITLNGDLHSYSNYCILGKVTCIIHNMGPTHQ